MLKGLSPNNSIRYAAHDSSLTKTSDNIIIFIAFQPKGEDVVSVWACQGILQNIKNASTSAYFLDNDYCIFDEAVVQIDPQNVFWGLPQELRLNFWIHRCLLAKYLLSH